MALTRIRPMLQEGENEKSRKRENEIRDNQDRFRREL